MEPRTSPPPHPASDPPDPPPPRLKQRRAADCFSTQDPTCVPQEVPLSPEPAGSALDFLAQLFGLPDFLPPLGPALTCRED